ncbi:type I-E CRISPR-associated protein Cse1/CasA [Photobacterium leiognathi]|uniref:type I-E CRISPR-associated protein Cse1/CasA n=1 Tax=Photobacterium leiognathi TaxID=553611 RepID=UPI001EDD6CB5|nr:type I-E CRISPR-associated protein Cse1/CasA [Photobacterium leiognathi]MCG3884867.1 type I-E CRISPR-associated protein Cse1/CasA [Photobacterium leiognathi]
MINGHPKTGSSVKTYRFKCDTLEDICDSSAAPMILNYHTFLTPMFSSKAVNGAAYNGTLNFIVGKNLRDTIILNSLVDDYSMIESLINKTELLTQKRQFPNFSMCGGDEKENISFNTLNIFEKLFHITTKLYVPTEQRQGICQCCDQERRRFIQAGGFFTNGTEIKNRININRDNVSHPYMPTLTSQEKDGPKIRPWDNNIPDLWSGLAEYITGKVDDGEYGVEIAQNVRLFCEGKIRYKHQTGLGLLNYAWNQASIKRRLYEIYSLTNGMSEYQAERVSELIQGINRVRNRMLASVSSNTIIIKGRTIRIVDDENNDISISKILGGSKDKKKFNNLRNKMQSDYLSLCDKKIPELLSLDLTDQKSKEYASNIIRDIVTSVFNKNLNWLERKGQAAKHIALLYKNSREISKIYQLKCSKYVGGMFNEIKL